MKKLKILYICYEDITGFNGAIRHVTEIVKGLSRNGHHLNLCVPMIKYKPPTHDFGDARILYIPTVSLPGIRPLSYILFSLFYLPCLFLIVRPDVVYVRDIKFTILPTLLAALHRLPCILEVNGLMDESAKIRKVKTATFTILSAFHKWNLRKASHLVTVTPGIKDEMISRYGVAQEKISIITNGVDLQRFKPAPMPEARARVGLAPDYKYVGFVGGLFPWHGLDQLVEAAPYILEKVPSARFVIVGSGMMESALKDMVANNGLDHAFIFTGSVPFDSVSDYVNSFNLCVVFFKKVRKDPGDPIKLYEYLACGRPVLASDVRGYGDLVEKIGAGSSVTSEDPIATADAIIKLLQDDGEAEAMGERGAREAQESFSWDKKAKETEMIMSRLIPS